MDNNQTQDNSQSNNAEPMSSIFDQKATLLPGSDGIQQVIINKVLTMTKEIIDLRNQASGDNPETQQQLLQKEGALGGKIFGELRPDQSRTFFCLNETTWIWSDNWFDRNERRATNQTVHYQVQKLGVTKITQGISSAFIEGDEFKNFFNAVTIYHRLVRRQVYGLE